MYSIPISPLPHIPILLYQQNFILKVCAWKSVLDFHISCHQKCMYKLIFKYPSVYSFISDSLRYNMHAVKFTFKCTVLWILTNSHVYLNQDTDHFHHPKFPPAPLSWPLLTQPQATTDEFSVPIVPYFPKCHTNVIIHCVAFDWASLSLAEWLSDSSRSLLVSVLCSFLLLSHTYWRNVPTFFYPFTSWKHPDCFQILVIIRKATTNLHVYVLGDRSFHRIQQFHFWVI